MSSNISKAQLWGGRVASALPVLVLLASGAMKLVQPSGFAESVGRLGYPLSQMAGIGILELACMVIYLIPRTSVLGAILLTAYLGGATATHVRIGELSAVVVPVLLAVLAWGGLYLRDARIRSLIPLLSEEEAGLGGARSSAAAARR